MLHACWHNWPLPNAPPKRSVPDSAPATVTIDVTDHAPTVDNLAFNLPENTTLKVPAAEGLLSAASDADDDPLTISGSTQTSDGELTVNDDGSFTYTPSTNYTGSDSFDFTVSDGALTTTATVTLTVDAGNAAPTASDASYSVVHDNTLDVAAKGLLDYASDSDGDFLTVSEDTGPSHGSVTVNSDGSFTYTPDTHYTGSDSFTYTASDGSLSSDPATVTISVTDQAPVAKDDSYDVERNNDYYADSITGVLANDTDPDGDALTARVVSQPSNGTLDCNSDGSFTYTPNHNFTGTDSFTYKDSDGVLTSNTATVTLTVQATPPVAYDDIYNVLHDTTLNVPANGVLANDYDADNLSITAGNATQPSHGSVTLNSDGSFTYTPDAGYIGKDSFNYEAIDSTGLTSDPATVNIDVTSNDTAPTAGNLTYKLDHDTTLNADASSGVLSAASDSDGDQQTAKLVSGPADGTLTLNADGSFSYTPKAGFFGTDSFSFQAFDGTGYSNTATATLNVVNDNPTANPDKYTVKASGTTTVSPGNGVLANDTDGENDPLTAVLVSQPSYGSVTLNSDGSFSYTPNSNFTGSDSFTYKAYDGVNYSSPATVTLTRGPVASDENYSVVHDKTLNVDAAAGLLSGASDADGDTLTAALASGPQNGSVTVNSDGSFTYTPNAEFVGADSFTFTVSDGTNTSSPATATIDVTDDVPTAQDDSYSTPANTALSVNAANAVLANDSDDDGDSLTTKLASGPSHGTLELSSGGNFTYTPKAGYTGSDSFTYTASDGRNTSNTATVTLTVLVPITGQVWLDSNEDGIEDNSEAGMSNVTVNLVTPDGALVTSTTTEANGDYQLNVDPSLGIQFQVQVIFPDGYSATIPFASSTGIYSSIDYTGYTNVLTLPPSGGIRNVNAGLASSPGPLGSISGEVWLDSDEDGILDASEDSLQGINVNLLDSNGNVLDSTSTDDNGDYSFQGLSPNTPYTVQFVAPNGYVFAPQNVGQPSTSSSADPNGDTDPITLSPGQNDTTVNAGLNGDAPIVYQTNVAMTAENDVYTDMDFTVDGYDPNGEPLTPIIVKAPTVGSLVYDTSTGLYDYTAPTYYTGLDSFEFELSNGHAVSAVVNVHVLAYTGIIPLGTYDSFPTMETDAGLFNGPPSQSSIQQGDDINDCWFVAAAAGFAEQNPGQIVKMIKYNAYTGQYQVKFPGQKPVTIEGFEHDGHTYSESNGNWLAVLEKAYGQMIYNQKWVTWGNTPYNYISRGNTRNTGIEALTGHSTDTDAFRFTSDKTTRTKISNALVNTKVIVAGTGGSSLSDAKLKAMGLVPHHSYTVVGYDSQTDEVRLYNPWGRNPVFNNGTDPRFWLGKNDPGNPPPATLPQGGNGYFWMSLTEFTKAFHGIAYEE